MLGLSVTNLVDTGRAPKLDAGPPRTALSGVRGRSSRRPRRRAR